MIAAAPPNVRPTALAMSSGTMSIDAMLVETAGSAAVNTETKDPAVPRRSKIVSV
jgi:hypothetical protein